MAIKPHPSRGRPRLMYLVSTCDDEVSYYSRNFKITSNVSGDSSESGPPLQSQTSLGRCLDLCVRACGQEVVLDVHLHTCVSTCAG